LVSKINEIMHNILEKLSTVHLCPLWREVERKEWKRDKEEEKRSGRRKKRLGEWRKER